MKYEDYLKHKDAEWTTRWENVQELINFATEPRGDGNWGVGEGGVENENPGEKYGSECLQDGPARYDS